MLLSTQANTDSNKYSLVFKKELYILKCKKSEHPFQFNLNTCVNSSLIKGYSQSSAN